MSGFEPLRQVKHPAPLVVTDGADIDLAAVLGSLPCFDGDEAAMLQGLRTWKAKCILDGEEWDVPLYGIENPGSSSLAIFVHGFGRDRCAAFWAKFWFPVWSAGYSIIALDLPGHGQSTSAPLPTRGGQDGDLLRSVLHAFSAGRSAPATCFSDAGAASTFFRAFCAEPALFAAHHLLLNPITPVLGPELKLALESEGADLKVVLAEGWGATDVPFSVANCKQLFVYAPQIPDRIEITTLRPTGTTAFTIKAMKPPGYLAGASVKAALPRGGGNHQPPALPVAITVN
jgi:pimeloyl-ACP methyl ester carboxylesterase